LHLYPVNQADCPAISSLSREPYGRVEIETLTSAADADWPQSLPGTAVLGAMLRSSQIAGAIAQVLALSVDYAQIRKQFGKQIGRFQAVQQMLAELAAEAAAARSCADAAWAALDQGGSVEAVAAVAKVRTAKAARTAAAIAHQVHGAIGVTDEYILHYHTRRLWQWRLDFGGEAIWAERLGAAHRDSGCDLWTFLITRCCPAAPTEAISC
jgi:acyl-CoA dehydrogenase